MLRSIDQRLQLRHLVIMISSKTFHSFIDQRQRLAIVIVPIHTVAPPSDYDKS